MKFDEVSEYKINIQKYVASLYTNNELSEGAKNPIYNFIKKNKMVFRALLLSFVAP